MIPVVELQPITPLKIDPWDAVAVHVHALPMIGGPYGGWGDQDDLLVMRGDGSRCSNSGRSSATAAEFT